MRPVFSREEAYAGWSRLHGGIDPRSSMWISGWVRIAHICATPLVRAGVSPSTVTVAGVAVMAAVPLIASAGAAWPMVAMLVILVGAVLDGVDGAIAVRAGKASRWGRVLDPFADRCSDLLLILTLVVLGAPVWLGISLALLTLLLESVRAHAQATGMEGPGVLTWWERPSRVIVASFATATSAIEWGVRRSGIDVLPALDGVTLVTIYAIIATVLAVAGLAQLLLAVHSELED
ncbi:CDP-alcohol phosphatidyltransferase family protein [Williamsia muralis]|uniref:CDP-alcohol phosphatidyltransferase family protein n=1 Tax=Williamsia marianensis TaxID=85044 RepID=UPI003826EB83